MKRTLCLSMIVACIAAMGSGLAMAEPATLGFGFGGAMAMAFFPDMTGINTYMSENGMPPMGDVLIGAGGGGRGGVIGGPAFGGIGWGLLATSESEDRYAELVFGGGGFDIGAAIGGDEGSVLTVGAVLGGGANVLTLTGTAADPAGFTPSGVVPEPTSRELVRAVGFVQPYVSLSAQWVPWVGFELRLGYVLPVLGIDFGDSLGIPGPSLELSGPTVSFGIVFGGIGSAARAAEDKPDGRAQVTATSNGSFVVHAEDELTIRNALGDIVISGYAVEVAEGEAPPDLVVEWQATRTCREQRIDELQVVTDVTDTGATLRTVGTGRIDYVLRVPAGLDLKVRNSAGSVRLVSHEAQTIIVENGVGDVEMQGVRTAALIVALGAGRIDLPDVDAQQVIVDLGVGDIALSLPASVSATVTAKAKIGEVSIDPFPGMIGGVRGFLGESGDVTLGGGERTVRLSVSVGNIEIEMRQP
jgi:hypothetical protein